MPATLNTVRHLDFQGDVWESPYTLIEHLGADLYTAKFLPAEPRQLDAILALAAAEEEAGYRGMLGDDKLAGAQAEWDKLNAQEGETFKVRLTSREAYEAAF